MSHMGSHWALEEQDLRTTDILVLIRRSLSLSRVGNAKVMDDGFNQHVLHVWNQNLDLQNE